MLTVGRMMRLFVQNLPDEEGGSARCPVMWLLPAPACVPCSDAGMVSKGKTVSGSLMMVSGVRIHGMSVRRGITIQNYLPPVFVASEGR